MKDSLLKQLDGYEDVAKEIEISRKFGVDYRLQPGDPAEYVGRYHNSRMRLRVTEIMDETPSTKTFRLAPCSGVLPPFQAGQYIALLMQFGDVRTTRAYSMTTTPRQTGYYDITVRRVPDGFVSGYLHDEVKVGDVLEAAGPAGDFHYNPIFHGKSLVFLAGGCGIAPFMSMIREVATCGLDREIHLFYGNKDTSDIIFHEELIHIASHHGNIHYIPVIEEAGAQGELGCNYRPGLMTGDLFSEELGDLTGKTFYMCGPSAMYDFCGAELEKLGIPKRRVRRELYGAPRNISKSPGWPAEVTEDATFQVTVNGKDTIPARAGEPLLTALERAGIIVPSLCRSGECSLCRVKLVSGDVFQPEGVLLRVSDRRYGFIHSCAAYPLGDLALSV